eukprot:jgi/Tetstr1/423169/TSEL_013937.t1
MLACSSSDQDKTRLPHLVPWDKDVEKKDLLQCHLACVRYNGSRPDDVYYVFDCFPHDSSNTITVKYKTAKKEIERLGEALDTVWFQFDNTFRENNSKHTHEHVDQLFSKFSVWLDDHAAFTKAQFFHDLRQAFTLTCSFMELEGVIDIRTLAERVQEEHLERVMHEKHFLKVALQYSRRHRYLFVYEIDGMDQDKTCLPDLVPWDKDVEKKDLMQCRLTCVKYNGSRPES